MGNLIIVDHFWRQGGEVLSGGSASSIKRESANLTERKVMMAFIISAERVDTLVRSECQNLQEHCQSQTNLVTWLAGSRAGRRGRALAAALALVWG
jgi:hypothetical protein